MEIANKGVFQEVSSESFRNRGQAILDAARELLLQDGESRLTIEAIAKKADLGKGTVYHHFQSKTELYVCLLIEREREIAQLLAKLQLQIERDRASIKSVLQTLVNWKLQLPNAEYEFNKIETAVYGALDKKHFQPELLSELKELRTRTLRHMSQLLTGSSQSDGESESSLQYQRFVFTVLMSGIAHALNANYSAFYCIEENSRAELADFTARMLQQIFSRVPVPEAEYAIA